MLPERYFDPSPKPDLGATGVNYLLQNTLVPILLQEWSATETANNTENARQVRTNDWWNFFAIAIDTFSLSESTTMPKTCSSTRYSPFCFWILLTRPFLLLLIRSLHSFIRGLQLMGSLQCGRPHPTTILRIRNKATLRRPLSIWIFVRSSTIASNTLSSKTTYSLLITIVIVHGFGWDSSKFLEC